MKNEHINEDITAYLSGDLDPSAMRNVETHLAMCAACSAELKEARETWEALGRLPAAEPQPVLRDRFYDMLRAYEAASTPAAGRMQKEAVHRYSSGAAATGLSRFFRPNPAFQFGFAAVMLLAGIFIGTRLDQRPSGDAQIGELREEVRGMGRMLTMSLLQQQSASERLRGVSWSQKLDLPDEEITGTLIHALSHDGNVNVRLAALDALSRQATDENVRRDMLRALPRQSSPLVQLAMIDLFIQLQYKPALDVFRTMAADPEVNETVKTHLQQGLKQLS